MSRHYGLTCIFRRIRIAEGRRNETLFLWIHNHPIHDLVAADTTAARDPAASLTLRKEMPHIAPSTEFRKSSIPLPASFSSSKANRPPYPDVGVRRVERKID